MASSMSLLDIQLPSSPFTSGAVVGIVLARLLLAITVLFSTRATSAGFVRTIQLKCPTVLFHSTLLLIFVPPSPTKRRLDQGAGYLDSTRPELCL